MKKIKFIILSGLFLIFTCIFTPNTAFAAFSTSDLEGTWYGHTLVSEPGSGGEWDYLTVTIDSLGNFTAQVTESGGNTNSDSGKVYINSSGIITIEGESAAHGVMSNDKNFFVITDTWDPGEYAMQIFIKGGGTFSQSDLTGTWYAHCLTSGSEEVWQYGTVTIDGAGNVSVQITDSDGDYESANNVASVSISGNGILSDALEPSFHGVMSSDKNIVVFTETWEGGDPYALMFLVKSGGSFTLTDLEGTWHGHTLVSGSGWQGWEYSTITIDGAGVASASFTDSEGGSDSGSETLSIDSNGIISVSGVSTSHGAMSLDKNLAVFTETGGTNEYHLTVIVKEDTAAPFADFSAAPLTGNRPLNVSFTDSSTGDISSWSWNFGDGSTSTAQNPSHTYISVGKYSVSLTVTGSGGSDVETKTGYIEVKIPGMSWLPILLDE